MSRTETRRLSTKSKLLAIAALFGVGLVRRRRAMAAVVALLLVQFASTPQFQQSSLSQRITASAQQQIDERDDVELISAQASFSRARPHGENPVLLTIYVEGTLSPAQEIRLAAELQANIEDEYGVPALVDLTALSH